MTTRPSEDWLEREILIALGGIAAEARLTGIYAWDAAARDQQYARRLAVQRGGERRADKLQRQTALPRPAGSGKRDQPNGLICKPLMKYFHVSFAADENGQRRGESYAGQRVDGRAGGRCPCARKQRLTGRFGQIERRRERAHGLELGPPPFATLERAHGMDRQPRNRRELLLSETGSLAERLELTAE